MYTVYALYNLKHNKIYIGQTEDLERRVELHRTKALTGYTSRYDGEWIVIYEESQPSRVEALVREKQLKSFRGREFIRTQIPV